MSDDKEPVQENAIVLVERTKAILTKQQPKIAKWTYAGGVPAEALIRMTLSEMTTNEKLRRSTPVSIYLALLGCAQTGLEPGSLKGEAYLVPYWNSKIKGYEAKFQAGYKGLEKQARRSGAVKVIASNVVFERDTFDMDLGNDNKIVHRPYLGADPGDVIGAYCWGLLADGFRQIEWVRRADLDAIQKFAERSGTSPAWQAWPNEQRRKTAIRRWSKHVPMGQDYYNGMRIEAADDDDIAATEVMDQMTDGEATRDLGMELMSAAAFAGVPDARTLPEGKDSKPAAAKASAKPGASKPPIDTQSTERPTASASASSTSQAGSSSPSRSAPASTSNAPASTASPASTATASSSDGSAAAGPAASSTPAGSATSPPASIGSATPAATVTAISNGAASPALVQAEPDSAASEPATDEAFNTSFGEDPPDSEPPPPPVEKSLEGFKAWAAGCATVAALEAGKPEWMQWSAKHYKKGDPATLEMQDVYGKRKAHLVKDGKLK